MMVRKVDELGRIVLPVEFRKALNIGTGCDVNIELKDGSIVLTPNECVFDLQISNPCRHKVQSVREMHRRNQEGCLMWRG